MVFWRTPLVGCAFFALGDVKYVLAQFVNDVPAHYVKYAPARFVNDVLAKKRDGMRPLQWYVDYQKNQHVA